MRWFLSARAAVHQAPREAGREPSRQGRLPLLLQIEFYVYEGLSHESSFPPWILRKTNWPQGNPADSVSQDFSCRAPGWNVWGTRGAALRCVQAHSGTPAWTPAWSWPGQPRGRSPHNRPVQITIQAEGLLCAGHCRTWPHPTPETLTLSRETGAFSQNNVSNGVK